MSFITKLLKPFSARQNPAVRRVYDQLVAQARLPVFYENNRVEDTVSGRFDMIVFHAFLLFHRLKREDEAAKVFGQDVFDTFIEDMDRSLREMGVGYQAVPKRMKKMGEAFYGRIAAYDSAVESQDEGAMAEAIERNVFPEHERASNLSVMYAAYAFACINALDTRPLNSLQNDDIPFADPHDFVSE
ncbi:MAG: ubiquinol-cytochrome C chaperone family protein [Hyphomicrobiales bacterium]